VADRFPLTRIPQEVRDIAARLIAAGHEAWFVGGAVRDVLLEAARGRAAPDLADAIIDIATSAKPEDVQALFKRTVPVGIEHGTVAVLDTGNRAHEVTTFRKDVRTDGRHAEVAFGASLEEDLARRDFTINAMAVHPESGDVKDPFGGEKDLSAGLVRAVGEPDTRFKEDYLRVLRALRFAATLDFRIEPATWAAVRSAAGELSHLSRERVRDEWLKTLAAPPSVALGLWREAGVLGEVWPELAALPADADKQLDEVQPRDPILITAAALARSGVEPSAAQAAVKRMRFSNRDIDRVKGITQALAETLPDPANGAAVRHWMSRHRAVARDAAAVAGPGGALLRTVEAAVGARVPLSIGDLAVRGDDLAAAGIQPGPQMGAGLRRLLDLVLEDPSLNVREALLDKAKSWS
jgi:tRNA nucleotidyltransferase (CCA-adding enzyme)